MLRAQHLSHNRKSGGSRMSTGAKAERGTHSASPVLLCLGWSYFFFVVFLAAFFAAFLVAICLFSLSIEHRCCNCKLAANEGIDLMKFSVKKNRAFNETFFAPDTPATYVRSPERTSRGQGGGRVRTTVRARHRLGEDAFTRGRSDVCLE